MKLVPHASWLLTAALLAGGGTAARAQEAEPELDVAPPPIEVSVDCDSSPERVTVTNNTRRPIRLRNVGSTFQRRAGEPYKVRKTLKPGKSASYTFGAGRGKGKRLTGSFIFDNEAPGEGVLVKSNRGKVRLLCDEGTNAASAPVAKVPETEPGDSGSAPAAMLLDAEPLELLASLPIEPEVEDGYDRALFEHWIDADADGCDTRQEVLIRDSLTPVTFGDGCDVERGRWLSAADGDTLTNPASVDINHVVPLKEAWASGAYSWTPERRQAFANDLGDARTLQAVSAGANREQGQNDPASWLPADREAACQFVRAWVVIKSRWELSVDDLERAAIEATLEACAARAEA